MEFDCKLTVLSIEALEGITSHLSGFEILSLWSCGNKTLNSALSKRGGVRVLRFISSSSDFPKLLILPSAVSDFEKLREIRMKCYYANRPGTLWLPRWSAVCSNLQKLDFKFPKDGNMLVNALTSNPSRFSNLTTLKFRTTTLIAPFKQLQLSNFPNLTTLLAGGEIAIVRLSDIPKTLIKLTLDIYHLEIDEGNVFPPELIHFALVCKIYPLFFALLPDTLKVLKIGINDQVASEDWQKLPRGLTSLTATSSQLKLHHIQALPMSLTAFVMEQTHQFYDWEAMMTALPPLLKTMPITFLGNLHASNVQYLPNSLEGELCGRVQPSLVHLLPPKITILDVAVETELRDLQGFPKFLYEVSLSDVDARIGALLPRTVQLIRIWGRCMLHSRMAPNLPPSLTELRFVNCPGVEDYEDIKKLPRSLKCLFLFSSEDILYGHEMPPESSSWLPRSLDTLCLGQADIRDPKWFSTLPPNLTLLWLGVVQIPPTSFVHLRHSKLDTIDIRILYGPMDQAARNLLPKEKFRFNVPEMLSNLPPTLTWFDFGGGPADAPTGPKITNKDLASLPKYLKKLVLRYPSKLSEDCLLTLPNTLDWFGVRPSKIDKWTRPWQQTKTLHRRNIYKTQLSEAAEFMGIDPNDYP